MPKLSQAGDKLLLLLLRRSAIQPAADGYKHRQPKAHTTQHSRMPSHLLSHGTITLAKSSLCLAADWSELELCSVLVHYLAS